jgi:hypothetical protein
MAFVHGKGAATLFGAYDLSAFLNNFDSAATADTAEVTVFGNGSKAYIGGLKDATVSLSGFFDGSAGAVDEVLSAALANVRVLTLGPAGFGAIGNRVQTRQCDQHQLQHQRPSGRRGQHFRRGAGDRGLAVRYRAG